MQKTAIDLLGFVFADQTNAEQHTQQEGQAKKVEQAASEAEQSHSLAHMLAATTSAPTMTSNISGCRHAVLFTIKFRTEMFQDSTHPYEDDNNLS